MKTIKAFFKTYFVFILTFLIGTAMAIWGQVKFDYTTTDAGVKTGEIVGFSGLGIVILTIIAAFILIPKGKIKE